LLRNREKPRTLVGQNQAEDRACRIDPGVEAKAENHVGSVNVGVGRRGYLNKDSMGKSPADGCQDQSCKSLFIHKVRPRELMRFSGRRTQFILSVDCESMA
jgi:hypothetical protein